MRGLGWVKMGIWEGEGDMLGGGGGEFLWWSVLFDGLERNMRIRREKKGAAVLITYLEAVG